MPTILTKKAGVCRGCGGHIRKGEYADFSAEEGLSHPEPQCRDATPRFRPNARAGRCSCGSAVPAQAGRLRLLKDDVASGGRKHWAVDCARCAGL